VCVSAQTVVGNGDNKQGGKGCVCVTCVCMCVCECVCVCVCVSSDGCKQWHLQAGRQRPCVLVCVCARV